MYYCKTCSNYKCNKLIYAINNNCIMTIHNGIGSCIFAKDCYVYPEENICNNFKEKTYDEYYYW